jgi:hypothetical protein
VFAAHNQFSSAAESYEAVSAPDRTAILNMIDIHDSAAMNPDKSYSAQTILELLQSGANPVT